MLSDSILYFLVGLTALLSDVTVGLRDCDFAIPHKDAVHIGICSSPQGAIIPIEQSDVVKNGSTCKITCLNDDSGRTVRCVSGSWMYEPNGCTDWSDVQIVRRKRFFKVFAAIFIAGLFLGRSGPPPDRSPPRVFCPLNIHRYADPIQTSTRISWGETTAYAVDDRDGRLSASRGSWKGPNYVFTGVTNIVYTARDKAGNMGHCYMKITVTTVRCSPGPSRTFRNGYYVCHPSSDFVYGTACNYGCYYGYKITGQKRRDCLKSGRWSSAEPQCEIVTCAPPDPFPEGFFQCNNGYSFKSACTYTCLPGYDVASGKSRVRVCGADGQWRGSVPTCIDSEAPKFTDCPRVLTFYTERGSSMALVDWNVPSVTDNSKQTIIPTQTSGISNSDYHSSGVYSVVYDAVDASGNRARSCKFKVVVKELKCFAQYPLPYMKVDCPNGYGYGAMCDFSCESGYAINGSETAVCERSDTYPPYTYWKMSRPQPTCEALNTCPALKPPDNGAMACDLWEDGNFCQMQCMKGTDIPPSFDNWRLFVCNLHGQWNFDGDIPPCSKIRNTRYTRMTVTIYYFDGSCPDAIIQIKQNFISALQRSPFNAYLDTGEMTVENVKVTCGQAREKRSTDSHQMTAKFDIVGTMSEVQSKEAFKQTEKRSNNLFNEITDDIKGGNSKLLPHLKNTTVPTVQVNGTQVELDCPYGTLPSYNSVGCAGCTSGTYFSSDKCKQCDVGFYQPEQGQIQCVPCPHGTTTLKPGARSEEDCLPQCKLGHFSANGVEPCTPCDLGHYSDALGRKECQICPFSTTTMQQGSTGLSSCKHFDITLTDKDTPKAEIEVEVKDLDLKTGFIFRMWLILTSESNGDIVVLRSSLNDWFSLKTTEKLQLMFLSQSSTISLDFQLVLNTWYQVQLNCNSTNLSVFVDDQKVFEDQITEPSWTVSGSLIAIIGGNGFEGSVSQVNMWRRQQTVPSPGSIKCFSEETGDVLSWGNFTSANLTEAFLQIPSECDDTNDCLSGPCIHGECTDILNGYTCNCDVGYSGGNCDVNIDDCVDNQCADGSVCEDGVSNYTCVCTPDYKGEYCDINIVHGGWGNWGNWSQCSTSCGPGERTRIRRCDNPLPQNGGTSCSGPDKVTGTCKDRDCPVCSKLDPPTNGKLVCEDEVGMRRCKLECEEGYDLDREPLPLYECGEETGYKWNFRTEDNPHGRFPNCEEITASSEMEIQYAASYVDLTCDTSDNHKQMIKSKVQLQTDEIPCIREKKCYIKDTIINNNCGNSRQKRNVVLANFIVILANNPSSNGIVPSMEDLSQAIQQLNSSALAGVFTVTIDGVTYYLQPIPDISGNVTCPAGRTKVNHYCIPCGPGTFYINGYCERCDIGRYSNDTESTFCHSCPRGKSTPGRASLSVEECTVDVIVPSDLPLAAILAGVLVPAFSIMTVIAICLFFKWKKQQAKVRDQKTIAKNPLGPVLEAWVASNNVAVITSSPPDWKSLPEYEFPLNVVPLKMDLRTEDLELEDDSSNVSPNKQSTGRVI